MAEDASVLLPLVDLYDQGQQKATGTPMQPKPAAGPTQELKWAPAEKVSADDISREEILRGVPGGGA